MISLPSLLIGCVVSNSDSSDYDYVPYIQTFQKIDSIGHTDTVQRKYDLHNCGLSEKINPDQWVRNYTLPEMSEAEHDKQISEIESCMKHKRYVLLDFRRCGPLKAPTGLCN